MLAAIKALGRRNTPLARQELEHLAGRRFPFWGVTRLARTAARKALEGAR